MKNTLLFSTLLFVIFYQSVTAQVGIGTTDPITALDVSGTVRVIDLPVETVDDISLSGLTGSNTLNRTNTGGNVVIVNNELSTAPVSRDMGDLNLSLEPIDRYVAGLPQIDNLDIKINIGGDNATSTFISVHTFSAKYIIAGIKDGTEGRRVTLFMANPDRGIKYLSDNSYALPKNRILTLATSSISTSGQGLVELVYDEDAGSDGLGRWLVIKFRS